MRGKNRGILFSVKRVIAATLLFAGIVAHAGCLSVRTNLADVTTSARPMETMDYEVLGEGEGQHSSFRLFWFFPVTPRADREKAIEEAVAAKGGDNLIFVRTWRERQHWVLGSIDIIHVRGSVIRYK
ncbi:MAG: hypothetical protein MUC76_14240 [Spirochaetes bacterium]|jgi:hypothetical protein|nr:hypothetical protein [Spirochaetota bacterium]